MDDSMNHSNGKQQPNEGGSPSLQSLVSKLVDTVAEQQYQRSFPPCVSLKDCIQYFKEEARKLDGSVSAAGFILSVKKNLNPRNENDNCIVVQGLVDGQNKPIIVNGESISRTIHTRTIDDALIRALKGKESGIFHI